MTRKIIQLSLLAACLSIFINVNPSYATYEEYRGCAKKVTAETKRCNIEASKGKKNVDMKKFEECLAVMWTELDECAAQFMKEK